MVRKLLFLRNHLDAEAIILTQVFARFFDNSVERREGRAVSLVKYPSYSTKLEVNAFLNMTTILDRLKGFCKIALENNFRTNNDRIRKNRKNRSF